MSEDYTEDGHVRVTRIRPVPQTTFMVPDRNATVFTFIEWLNPDGTKVKISVPANFDKKNIGENVRLGQNVIISGRNVTIRENAYIGDGVILSDNVHIGKGANITSYVTIGESVYIGKNVTIKSSLVIGDNVKIHDGMMIDDNVASGAKVGADVKFASGDVNAIKLGYGDRRFMVSDTKPLNAFAKERLKKLPTDDGEYHEFKFFLAGLKGEIPEIWHDEFNEFMLDYDEYERLKKRFEPDVNEKSKVQIVFDATPERVNRWSALGLTHYLFSLNADETKLTYCGDDVEGDSTVINYVTQGMPGEDDSDDA